MALTDREKKLEVIPFISVPVGWMPCVACSDFKKKPGQMWLGYSHGEDLFIPCPVCKGTGQVTRLKHLDARTGVEIDYERPGQRFVPADPAGTTASGMAAADRGSSIIVCK